MISLTKRKISPLIISNTFAGYFYIVEYNNIIGWGTYYLIQKNPKNLGFFFFNVF